MRDVSTGKKTLAVTLALTMVGSAFLIPMSAAAADPPLTYYNGFREDLTLLTQQAGLSDDAKQQISNLNSKLADLGPGDQSALDSSLGQIPKHEETGMFSNGVQHVVEQAHPKLITDTSSKMSGLPIPTPPDMSKIPKGQSTDFKQISIGVDSSGQNEVSIAANPKVTGNVIATSHDFVFYPYASNFARVQCAHYVTNDNGETWQTGIAKSHGTYGSDPSVAFDPQGNAYLNCEFLDFAPGTYYGLSSGFEVSKSMDEGRTWSLPVVVLRPPAVTATPTAGGVRLDYHLLDKPFLAAGPSLTGGNAVYMSYTLLHSVFEVNFNPFVFAFQDTTQIKLTSSSDGITWSSPVDVSPLAILFQESFPPDTLYVPNHVVAGSSPWVSSDGKLDVAWYDSRENPTPFGPHVTGGWLAGQFDVKVRRSVDGGVTWGQVHTAATKTQLAGGVYLRGFFLPPNFLAWSSMWPILRTDPTDSNRVYVTFTADPDPYPDTKYLYDDNSDIFFARSLDGGTTWNAAIRVNDDSTLNDQFYPAMTVQPNGNIFIAFGDRREDPSNRLYEIFIAVSTNGGATFGPNEEVSTGPSDPAITPGLFHIGDYFGITSTKNHIFVGWMDTRRDNMQHVFVGIAPSNKVVKSDP